jgi:hypothetical protein
MLTQIKQKLSLLANFILLSIVYFFGIGLTAFFAKIFGKSFLFEKNTNSKKTSFTDFKKSDEMEKMF